MPFGIKKTDEFLLKLSELFGKPVPEKLKEERGLAVDAMTDAHQYLHGKKFAVAGDPDYLIGIVSFLLEMGAIPYHVLCSRTNKKFEKEMKALLAHLTLRRPGEGLHQQGPLAHALACWSPIRSTASSATPTPNGPRATPRSPCSASASRSSTGSTCTARRWSATRGRSTC